MRTDLSQNEIERIARMCHAVNRNWCRELGDFSQPRWHEAPKWQTDSAIDGVKFHLANPDADASASHDNWLKQKRAEGWMYGKVKDPVAKTHPCMVPFEDLPWDQQVKDRLFKATVHAIAG